MVEQFNFADSETGLTLALLTTLSLRRNGFKTRLTTEEVGHGTTLHTVHAVRPPRPSRTVRLVGFNNVR